MSDLLKEENARYTVFPIKYKNIWDMYKKMQAAFWTAEEIDWSKDKHDFKNAPKYYAEEVLKLLK